MKVIFKKDFDYDLGGQKTAFCQAGPDPMTVKRELGEAAIAGGYAVLVDDGNAESDADAGNMGRADTGQDDKPVSGPTGIDGLDGNDDGDSVAKSKPAKAR